MRTTIKRIGNSAGVLVPAPLLKAAGLSIGSEIDLVEIPGGFEIKSPRPKKGKRELDLAWLLEDYRDPGPLLD